MTLDPLDYLDARDARQAWLERALAAARARGLASVVTLGANLPGADKHRPGVARLARTGLERLQAGFALEPFHQGSDLLGPFALLLGAGAARDGKRIALGLETGLEGGRLLDIDVYQADGVQLDRRALGLPARACLLCAEPAGVCARTGRHPAAELGRQVDALLRPYRPEPRPLRPELLARCLVQGARQELDLTPKPGLVDRHDPGSHPDLSYARMRASIDLLPRFYADLLAGPGPGGALEPIVQAGRDAEARMVAAIRSNAHKGYLFLSGLVLLAARAGDGRPDSLRPAIAGFARRFFGQFEAAAGQGGVRSRLGLGGIRAEAEQGLPAVFEAGWPRYREALEDREPGEAGYLLMAVLMQRVEDTTTVRRGGLAALERLRRDGAELQRRLEQRREVRGLLAEWNEDYVRLGLTMGGVADCMALTFALEAASGALG